MTEDAAAEAFDFELDDGEECQVKLDVKTELVGPQDHTTRIFEALAQVVGKQSENSMKGSGKLWDALKDAGYGK